MRSFLVGSGVICALMFALGFGLITPVSGVMSGLFYLLAVASGMAFFGLLEGE